MGKGETLRIAMVGCGRIADVECLGYLDHPRAEIYATCDVRREVAERRAQQWGATKAYTDFRQVLDDPAVDAVEILTPHDLHAEQAIAALEAGKHVSLQKPPARTMEEFDRIAAAAERSDRVFRVLENYMYYPPHVRAKELIEEGAIGMPLSVRLKTAAGRPDTGWPVDPSSWEWRLDPERCGGGQVTFDHGYHCFHMARYFMDADIERVHAFIDFMGEGGFDATALISWTYGGQPKRMGSWEVIPSIGLKVRSKYYAGEERTEIHGTDGIIWINRCTGKLLEEPAVVLYREGETRAFHHLPADWGESFRLAGRDFVDAVLEGRRPPLQLDVARRVLASSIAAQVSAREHREVAVSEIA
ncbi:MAG: gfo/Idh/MocA family oxidoreductase [Candidatus Dadabacteria bacterium]|nr:MAG: gfo/Idh/MocA family oxidoreductase [Candidatus Dadabacteria bacterium]